MLKVYSIHVLYSNVGLLKPIFIVDIVFVLFVLYFVACYV